MKRPKQILKTKGLEVKLTEHDYRGILSFTLTTGLIILLLKSDLQAASILGPLTGMAVGWYFSSGSKRRR